MKANLAGRPSWPMLPPKLQELTEAYQRAYFAPDPSPLLVTLATYAAFLLPGDSPLWVMIVGGPSSGKTSTMDCLRLLPKIHLCSTITAPGLLSGSSSKNQAKGATGGLLMEIGPAGLLALKDFTSILSMGRESIKELLAALREIYDGAWTRALGVDGGRRLSWEGKLGIIAACTTAIDEHAHIMAAMGERFLLYRLAALDSDEQEKMAAMALSNASLMENHRDVLAYSVQEFFEEFGPSMQVSEPEPDVMAALEGWATLTARCRSAVARNSITREIETLHAAEDPARLVGQLHQLEAGLSAIGVPLTWRLRIVRKIARDCIPPVRCGVVSELARYKEPVDIKRLAVATRHPKTTTWRAVDDLRAHGVVRFVGDAAEAETQDGRGREREGHWGLGDEWRERWHRFPKRKA